jgi:hypothetical protein
MTAPDLNADQPKLLTVEEQWVLSKAASGGGFLVPTDLAKPEHLAAEAYLGCPSSSTRICPARPRMRERSDRGLAVRVRDQTPSALTVDRLVELHGESGQVGYRVFGQVDGRPTLTATARILAHSAS